MFTISPRVLGSVSVFNVVRFFYPDKHFRVNIANAAVFGLKTELGLKGNEYNVALVILFVWPLGTWFTSSNTHPAD